MTQADVDTLFPFINNIVVYNSTGAQLLKMVQGSVSGKNLDNGAVVGSASSWSGLRYHVQENGMVSVTVGGDPIDPSAVYTILTNDFSASGGDGDLVPGAVEFFDTKITVEDAVVTCLSMRASIMPQ